MSPITWQPTNVEKKPDSPSPGGWDIGDPWFGISMGLLGAIAGYAANIYIF